MTVAAVFRGSRSIKHEVSGKEPAEDSSMRPCSSRASEPRALTCARCVTPTRPASHRLTMIPVFRRICFFYTKWPLKATSNVSGLQRNPHSFRHQRRISTWRCGPREGSIPSSHVISPTNITCYPEVWHNSTVMQIKSQFLNAIMMSAWFNVQFGFLLALSEVFLRHISGWQFCKMYPSRLRKSHGKKIGVWSSSVSE